MKRIVAPSKGSEPGAYLNGEKLNDHSLLDAYDRLTKKRKEIIQEALNLGYEPDDFDEILSIGPEEWSENSEASQERYVGNHLFAMAENFLNSRNEAV
jgi:hypothetical protein